MSAYSKPSDADAVEAEKNPAEIDGDAETSPILVPPTINDVGLREMNTVSDVSNGVPLST